MPTTRKTVVDVDADATLDPAVGDVGADGGDYDIIGDDPRTGALAALLTAPPTVVSDVSPPPPARILPKWTQNTWDWSTEGEPSGTFIVWSETYPRMYGDERREARRGDRVVLDLDAKTSSQVQLGHLIPLE